MYQQVLPSRLASELDVHLGQHGDDGVRSDDVGGNTIRRRRRPLSALGSTTAWLLTNRRPTERASLHLLLLDDNNNNGGTGTGTGTGTGQPLVFHSTNEETEALLLVADPASAVEIYHLHCHFNAVPGSERIAAALLASLKAALVAAGHTPLHDHTWHEKNGPHDPWSWELWVEHAAGLGVAVEHLMRWERPENAAEMGLYLCLHADTDQEFTDHSARLAWIGPKDPHPLDLAFFPPAPATYAGPAGRERATNQESIFSMGEHWRRDPTTGLVLDYGAMDRRSIPSLFLPHGAPPVPIEPCSSLDWLATAAEQAVGPRPKGIVFMSPHFSRSTFTVSTDPNPATLMDFDAGTNPDALAKLHKLRYPARGDPVLAARVKELLDDAGIPCDTERECGFDHGVWTPLFVMYPRAEIPVVSLSIREDLDTAAHIAAGRALEPLRAAGYLLLSSGEAVHNVPEMGARDSPQQEWCLAFERWLEGLLLLPSPPDDGEDGDKDAAEARDRSLARWQLEAPFAERAHPPEDSPGEHLVPLFFAYGAGGGRRGKCLHKEYLGTLPMAAYEFGRGAEK